jgi:outer membrane protein, heavy metal efflux system
MLSLLTVAVLTITPPPLRLGDLLAEARSKSAELRAASARASAARESARAAGVLDDPRFLVQLWNAPVDFSDTPVMFQLSQTLPLGGRLDFKHSAAEADARAATAETAARLQDVELDVAVAYFDLYQAERTQSVNAGLKETLEALAGASAARLRTGAGQQADLLKAQVAVLEFEESIETATQEALTARARLQASLQRPEPVLGETTTPHVLAELPSEAALRNRALDARPELKQLAAKSQTASALVHMAEAERVPDINVFGAYMHTFGGVSPSNFIFAGLEFTLPIWGSKNDGRIGAARALGEAVSSDQAALRARVSSQVSVAFARVTTEERIVSLHHRIIPLMTTALESGRADYASGRGDFLSVLDSLRELRRHELELAMHLAAYAKALAELQRAVGEDVGLEAAAEGGTDNAHN